MRYALGVAACTLWVSLLCPSSATASPSSLLERVVPALPHGFRADASDPWGHKEGDQSAAQFAHYYNADLISPTELHEAGFLDAYSEFASAKTHKKSDYITVSLVRLASSAQAAALSSQFQQDLTTGLTPAPPGGSVRKLSISGIPGSEAYLSWFEGSAGLDAVFFRDGVVADIERTSPSKAAAKHFQAFARKLYARLKVGAPRFT